jgi:hypothetical protein
VGHHPNELVDAGPEEHPRGHALGQLGGKGPSRLVLGQLDTPRVH